MGLLISLENEVLLKIPNWLLQIKKKNCKSKKVTAKYLNLSMMALANHTVLNTF